MDHAAVLGEAAARAENWLGLTVKNWFVPPWR